MKKLFLILLSSVLTMSMLAEEPVIDNIYPIGSATPYEWAPENSQTLERDVDNPSIFRGELQLKIGEIKFLGQKDWGPVSIQPIRDNASLKDANITTSPEGDYKWAIPMPGKYGIEINLETKNIKFDLIDVPALNAYPVGDAVVPYEWDIAQSEAFTPDAENPYILRSLVILKAGRMKILAENYWGDPNTVFVPMQQEGSITNANILVWTGGEERWWQITEEQAAPYNVTIDILNGNINFAPINAYPVGDATPYDWSPEQSQAFGHDTNNPHILLGTLELKSGELKFMNENYWGNDDTPNTSIKPTKENASINETSILTEKGGNDYKWVITEDQAGVYNIVIDIHSKTIRFNKLIPNNLIYLDEGTPVASDVNVVFKKSDATYFANKIELEDGYDFESAYSFNAKEASYERTYASAGWTSLLLPFDMAVSELPQGVIVQKFTGIDGNSVEFTTMTSQETLVANTPYIARISTDNFPAIFTANNVAISTSDLRPVTHGKYTLTGTFNKITGSEAMGLHVLTPDGEGFAKTIEGASIPGFRVYIKDNTGAGTDQISFAKGGATEINDSQIDDFEIHTSSDGSIIILCNKEQDITIYRIDGCKVGTYQLTQGENIITGLSKGIYILNNKKIIL